MLLDSSQTAKLCVSFLAMSEAARLWMASVDSWSGGQGRESADGRASLAGRMGIKNRMPLRNTMFLYCRRSTAITAIISTCEAQDEDEALRHETDRRVGVEWGPCIPLADMPLQVRDTDY